MTYNLWSPLPFNHDEYKNNGTYRINVINYFDYYFEVLAEKEFDEFFVTVLNYTEPSLLENVAEYGPLPGKYLAELAKIDDDSLKQSVAFNSNTSLKTLKRLAKTENVDVLTAIAGNSNCSWEFLQSLIDKHSDKIYVVDAIIWNCRTPTQYFLEVLNGNDVSIKWEVLRRIKYLDNKYLYDFCGLAFGSDAVYVPENVLRDVLLKWVECETLKIK